MNKRLVWITELFIWTILLLLIILGFSYAFATSKEKNYSYYLFFKDVDGLSQGSIVRMMGLPIGYVRDVKVFNDDVFVSFLVTKENIKIPEGSIARVEFYGLGGSKSLEIEPMRREKDILNNEAIVTQKPYRVSYYYKWSEEINSTIKTIATETSDTLDTIKNVNITSILVKNSQELNNMVQSFVNKSEKKDVNKINEKLNQFIIKHKDLNGNLMEKSQENTDDNIKGENNDKNSSK